HEEEQAEEHAPEGAAQRPNARQAVELARLRLLRGLRPGDDRRVLHGDQLLALQALERAKQLICALRCGKLQYRERGHTAFLLSCPVMPCHALSCPVMPCHALSCLRSNVCPRAAVCDWGSHAAQRTVAR